MCQNRTDSQKPLSGAWANVQGHATAQLQLSNQSPVMCQLAISVMKTSMNDNTTSTVGCATGNGTAAVIHNRMNLRRAFYPKGQSRHFQKITTTLLQREKQPQQHAQSSARIEKASPKE